tara:strand:- start:1046 stop:1222 length:177 start_codon:yes stop_codon:yes gene_type:complete
MNIPQAVTRIWNDLDRTWNGDERPDDWDTTCEAMQAIMEGLGLQYDEDGDIIFFVGDE